MHLLQYLPLDFSNEHTVRLARFSFLLFIYLLVAVKKEFIGPGLHLRPICADHARLPLQWTLNSLLSACGNNNGRIRPPPDRGSLKITSRLLVA